jgi:hypothetical protein
MIGSTRETVSALATKIESNLRFRRGQSRNPLCEGFEEGTNVGPISRAFVEGLRLRSLSGELNHEWWHSTEPAKNFP